MADDWAYYDINRNRVMPKSIAAVAKGKEIAVPTGVPAPDGHGSPGTTHYVDVHAIGGDQRQTFTSFTKFKAWCAMQARR